MVNLHKKNYNSIIQIFKLDSELKNMDITEYMKTNFKGIKDWE